MSDAFSYKRGMRLPNRIITLAGNGLSNLDTVDPGSLNFVYRTSGFTGERKVIAAAISESAAMKIEVDFASIDTSVVAKYQWQVEATIGGLPLAWPESGFYTFSITDTIANGPGPYPVPERDVTYITPVAIGVSVDNYDPVDATSGASFIDVDVIRLATNAGGSTLTGLEAHGDDHAVIIENIGPGALTLKHDATSTVANRFLLPSLTDSVLPVGAGIGLIYDPVSLRWRATSFTALAGTAGTGTVGPGTSGKLLKFTGMTTTGDSSINDDGTKVQLPTLLQLNQLQMEPHITPTALSAGRTEDWNPTGLQTAGRIQVTTNTAGSELGGIVAPTDSTSKEGRVLFLLNGGDGTAVRGSGPLKIIHNSSGTALGNHIVTPDCTDLEVPTFGGCVLVYTVDHWFAFAVGLSGRQNRATIGDIWLPPGTPSALSSGNNNNYSPTGWTDKSLWLISGPAGAVITGLNYFGTEVANDPYRNSLYHAGMVRILVNTNAPGTAIRVTTEDANSSVNNRISSPHGDFEIPGRQACIFVYDYAATRWRAIVGNGSFSKLSLTSQSLVTLSAGNNNDFNPAGWAAVGHWRLQGGGGAAVLTGMLAQERGAVRTLAAFDPLTIKNLDANSSAGNRFYLPAAYQASGLPLLAGDCATFRYDDETAVWMCIGLGK